MVTITPEDHEKAGLYRHGDSCMLATALKRCGYRDVRVYSDGAEIDGHIFTVQGQASELGWDEITQSYNKSVIGKQFIFYPRPTPIPV